MLDGFTERLLLACATVAGQVSRSHHSRHREMSLNLISRSDLGSGPAIRLRYQHTSQMSADLLARCSCWTTGQACSNIVHT